MKRLLITTGDPDGVGSEVSCKALSQIGPQSGVQFVLWRSKKCPKSHLKLLDKKFDRVMIGESEKWPEPRSGLLIEIVSSSPPAKWVEKSAKLCLQKKADGIVTAPLSKTGIAAAGMKDRGHTEIFSRVCRTKDLYMSFYGRRFNVLLLTDHRPLMKVSRDLTVKRIRGGILAAQKLKALSGSRKPIALVGLNPHAGEHGLLGTEERAFRKFIKKSRVEGPLVPDTAFLPANWKKFSVFVCPYHDQGLIPFKMVHGFDEGVHLTLGLPFVRTSVDHGTAKELFNKNRAKSGSMREAIQLAISLLRKNV